MAFKVTQPESRFRVTEPESSFRVEQPEQKSLAETLGGPPTLGSETIRKSTVFPKFGMKPPTLEAPPPSRFISPQGQEANAMSGFIPEIPLGQPRSIIADVQPLPSKDPNSAGSTVLGFDISGAFEPSAEKKDKAFLINQNVQRILQEGGPEELQRLRNAASERINQAERYSIPTQKAQNLAQAKQEAEMLGITVDEFGKPPEFERMTVPQQEAFLGKGAIGRNIGAFQRSAAGVAEGFASPEGAAMFLGGGFAGLLGKAFLTDMAFHVPDQVKAYQEAEASGDKQAIADTRMQLLTTAGMLVAAGKSHKGNKASSIDEVVNQIKETEVPNASQVTGPEIIPQREIRTRLGEETPLRQQGEAAPTQGEPVARKPNAELTAKELIDIDPEIAIQNKITTGDAIEIGKRSKSPEDLNALREAEIKAQEDVRKATEAEDMNALMTAGHKKQIITEALDEALGFTVDQKTDPAFGFESKRKAALDELSLSAPAKSKQSSPEPITETAKPAPKTGGAEIIESDVPPPENAYNVQTVTVGGKTTYKYRLRDKSETAPPKAETLDDVYRIFEPAPKEKVPVKRQAVNVIEAVRTGVSSRFRPLNKLAQDVAQAYGLKKPKDIAGIAEQLKGSQGKGEAEIYRFDRDVSSKVSGSEKDFNAYVFLRRSLDRLNQDLKDIQQEIAEPGSVKTLNRRSVSNYTIPQLESKLALLESKIRPEKLKAFEEAADMYQKHMDQALRLQVESGRMSVDQYNAIKSGNEFYAPFKVMRYMEMQSKPEGAGSRIDTAAEFTKAMKGIEDPNFKLGDMLAAARQSILMSRILADKNTVMRNISELSAFDTNGLFIKKLKSTQDAPTGMKAVKVLEKGKETRYAVEESVYDALDLFGGRASGVISKLLSASSVPFRAGATALNLPFQVSNLMADIPRTALMSKYGVKDVGGIINPFDAARFILGDYAPAIFDSIAANVFGRKSKLYLDFLDSGAAASTVQSALTPGALTFKEPTSISKSRRMAESVLYSLPRFSNAIEQTSKIVGIKRAMRMEGVKSGKELAKQIPEAVTEVRRFSGSPDFGRQGKWIEAARLNLLYMFLNARVQGAIADIGRLTGRDGAKTAAKAWVKIGTVVGIPTVYLWTLNNRPENRDDYAKRSQQERDNYWLIPKGSATGEPQYIETEDGEKVRDYWRIPKRESSKWVANMTEQMLNFSEKKDPEAARDFANSMFQELVPVNIQGDTATEKLESVASGLNPLIKAPLELATGRDLYRHRDVMNERMRKASPELQFTDRTATAFKTVAEKMPDIAPEFLRSPIILENLTKNLTAGLLTQFAQRKPVKGRSGIENNPLLQRFQSLPFVDNTEFKTEMQEMERESADAYLTRYREATKLLNDNEGKPLADFAGQASDLKTFRMLVDLYVSRANGATSQDRQVLSLPAEQRAKYVMHQLDGLNPEQKMQAMLDLARKRILTEAVFQEMARQLQDETQTQARP